MNKKLFSLNQRIAVVTGATGLLGQEHCQALSEAGAFVVVADMDLKKCEEVARELPGESFPCTLDVTDSKSIQALKSHLLTKFDRIDILVNNAAINDKFEDPISGTELSKLENYPLEHWNRMMSVNVTGVFLCSQVIGSEMAKRKGGKIINIASTYGMVAPDQRLYQKPDGSTAFYKSPAYSASKGAVISLTRFLASYWAANGVNVNCLSPGGVQNGQEDYFIENYSNRTPMGRMAEASDYRGALVFLASEASNYMTGANLVVDGGWTAW